MTTLEKGKFVKNFVRTSDGKKIPHSNWKGYSVKDIADIEAKIDESYWLAWEKYLIDKKNDEPLQVQYSDYQHFLFALNSIDEKDIKKYGLPEDYIVID